jgi:peptide/nickel transport system substrate-binding protein
MTCKNAYEDNDFKKMIGTGMWMIDSYEVNQEVVLIPNQNYWGKKPKLDKIILREVTEGETRLMAIQNGEADISISDMPAESKDIITSVDNLDNLSIPGTQGFFIIFNSECEELKNINIRKAINYSVHKEGIVKHLLDNAGVPLKGIFPETVPYVNSDNSKGYEYNIKKAKKLFEIAGYNDSDGDGYLEKMLSIKLIH